VEGNAHSHRASLDEARAIVCARLQARRPEIEQAILARAYAVSDPALADDPAYVQGLRVAVSAALGYGFSAIERGERRSGPIPTALFAQARQAARNAVGLDTVLRRYFAGYTLLGDFLMREAEGDRLLRGAALQCVQRDLAAQFDRLVVAVTDEYTREEEEQGGARSHQQRRLECVRRLLAGELIETAELAYELDAWHLGAIAAGPGAEAALRHLAAALDRRLLLVRRDEVTVWAWLGGGRRVATAEVASLASSSRLEAVSLAIGEPGDGLAGWRLTHQQARAALPIALRDPQPCVRYADVALLASILQDSLLATSLRQLYLSPLAEERDGGAALRQTLRAYFACERNSASAAASVGVTRQTVNNRLRVIEERIGRPLNACASELEAALRIEELAEGTAAPGGFPLQS
jgi:hypothetical protein